MNQIKKTVLITSAILCIITILFCGTVYFIKTTSNVAANSNPSTIGVNDTLTLPDNPIANNSTTDDSTTAESSTAPQNITTPENTIIPDNLQLYNSNDFPAYSQLDVEVINQYPELPTGCEITSLTIVLNHLGYDEDKEDLAKNYLIYYDEVREGCFMEYFYGSPWDPEGCGCFAPALMNVATSFLTQNNSSYQAHNISYSTPQSLFAEVANGNPVIVWTSLDYSQSEIVYQTVDLGNGTTFDWPINEHCVVLSGYDYDNQTVTFADPTYGKVTHSMNDFIHFYSKFYNQAIVIK